MTQKTFEKGASGVGVTVLIIVIILIIGGFFYYGNQGDDAGTPPVVDDGGDGDAMMEEDKLSRMREEIENASPEARACIEEELGVDVVNAILAGEGTASSDADRVIHLCAEGEEGHDDGDAMMEEGDGDAMMEEGDGDAMMEEGDGEAMMEE